jgi:hypothetical protein
MLFARWRPGRVPVKCAPGCPASSGGLHIFPCYRQQRKDLSRVPIDYDYNAITFAVLGGFAWWALLFVVAVACRPRELGAERIAREKSEREEAEARKARLQAEISALEKEADEQRDLAGRRRECGVADQPGCGGAPAGAAGPAGGSGCGGGSG